MREFDPHQLLSDEEAVVVVEAVRGGQADKRAVLASEVLKDGLASFEADLGVAAGDMAIKGEGQVALLASDGKCWRRRVQNGPFAPRPEVVRQTKRDGGLGGASVKLRVLLACFGRERQGFVKGAVMEAHQLFACQKGVPILQGDRPSDFEKHPIGTAFIAKKEAPLIVEEIGVQRRKVTIFRKDDRSMQAAYLMFLRPKLIRDRLKSFAFDQDQFGLGCLVGWTHLCFIFLSSTSLFLNKEKPPGRKRSDGLWLCLYTAGRIENATAALKNLALLGTSAFFCLPTKRLTASARSATMRPKFHLLLLKTPPSLGRTGPFRLSLFKN